MKVTRRAIMRSFLCAAASTAVAASANAAASEPPSNVGDLITPTLMAKLREILSAEIVRRSVHAQNAQYGDLTETQIKALDDQWRAERKSDDRPLISMTLSSPLSSYLTRVQANELGLFAAIFVMDANGLNVGQSATTSDFWQGDEAKFQKTFQVSSDAVFIDAPEHLEDFDVWIVQVSMTLADETTGKPIGAATFDLNIAELQRRGA